VNEGIRVSMPNVPADSSTKTFMLQIVGWVGKIVIPMSEALRAADNKQLIIITLIVKHTAPLSIQTMETLLF
jgi:hypothetical protein